MKQKRHIIMKKNYLIFLIITISKSIINFHQKLFIIQIIIKKKITKTHHI
jgi:hypothetical protein